MLFYLREPQDQIRGTREDAEGGGARGAGGGGLTGQGVVGGRRSVEQIETEEALGGEREIVGGKRLRSRRSGRFIQS